MQRKEQGRPREASADMGEGAFPLVAAYRKAQEMNNPPDPYAAPPGGVSPLFGPAAQKHYQYQMNPTTREVNPTPDLTPATQRRKSSQVRTARDQKAVKQDVAQSRQALAKPSYGGADYPIRINKKDKGVRKPLNTTIPSTDFVQPYLNDEDYDTETRQRKIYRDPQGKTANEARPRYTPYQPWQVENTMAYGPPPNDAPGWDYGDGGWGRTLSPAHPIRQGEVLSGPTNIQNEGYGSVYPAGIPGHPDPSRNYTYSQLWSEPNVAYEWPDGSRTLFAPPAGYTNYDYNLRDSRDNFDMYRIPPKKDEWGYTTDLDEKRLDADAWTDSQGRRHPGYEDTSQGPPRVIVQSPYNVRSPFDPVAGTGMRRAPDPSRDMFAPPPPKQRKPPKKAKSSSKGKLPTDGYPKAKPVMRSKNRNEE